MALPSYNPTSTNAWSSLKAHFETIKNTHMSKWFAHDAERANQMTIKWDDFYVDYSKNRITPETKTLLLQLANDIDLKQAITKYFSGDIINETEGRAVAHVALRDPKYVDFYVNGDNVMPEIRHVKKQIKTFTEDILKGKRKGYTNKPFTDIVN
ncbi:MAG: glucose-6-phosphate isomerase, partial [Gelidibacter sp.]|nr:glucose-6-phosphate isomerase [Gelidibacter sp.]